MNRYQVKEDEIEDKISTRFLVQIYQMSCPKTRQCPLCQHTNFVEDPNFKTQRISKVMSDIIESFHKLLQPLNEHLNFYARLCTMNGEIQIDI